jgi:hypothetical protein
MTAPRSLRIGDTAPLFRARATLGEVSLDQYRCVGARRLAIRGNEVLPTRPFGR